jgi:hypothetical protein
MQTSRSYVGLVEEWLGILKVEKSEIENAIHGQCWWERPDLKSRPFRHRLDPAQREDTDVGCRWRDWQVEAA